MAFQAMERLVFILEKWEIIGWFCSLSEAHVPSQWFECYCVRRRRGRAA